MEERYYVISVTTVSSGAENRDIKYYTDKETALRKFFEPLGNIGGGPTRICVLLLDQYFNYIKREVWEHEEPEIISAPIIDTNPQIDPSTGYPYNNN